MVTKLILIRHGETNYNQEKRYCGFRDVGLNKIGRLQAEEIKNKTKRLKIDKVITSDLKRSIQTAEIIFGKRAKILKNPNLREINFGEWEGLTYQEILKKHPYLYRKWLKDPFSVDIPDGEKTADFISRIKKEIKNIVTMNTNKTVAIVTHAGPMRVILKDALGLKKEDFRGIELTPQRVYVIEYKWLKIYGSENLWVI